MRTIDHHDDALAAVGDGDVDIAQNENPECAYTDTYMHLCRHTHYLIYLYIYTYIIYICHYVCLYMHNLYNVYICMCINFVCKYLR